MQIVPAGRNVEPQYVEMMVPLYSYGCERKVNKVLSHIKGKFSSNIKKYIFSYLIGSADVMFFVLSL